MISYCVVLWNPPTTSHLFGKYEHAKLHSNTEEKEEEDPLKTTAKQPAKHPDRQRYTSEPAKGIYDLCHFQRHQLVTQTLLWPGLVFVFCVDF